MTSTMARRGRRGFTLIELLVVVAIIALLISILLPSLSKARETARTVKCSAILKNYGAGNAMYADAYDGVHVPPWVGGRDSQGVRARMIWYRNQAFRQFMGMTGTNWEASEGLLCPSAPEPEFTNSDRHQSRSVQPWSGHWDHVYANQIYRIVFGNRRYLENGIFIRRSWIFAPADKFNFVDATNYEVGGVGRINGTTWIVYGDRTARRGGTNHIAYRHGEMGLNALHFDGHAEFYNFADAWPASTVGQDRHWLVYSPDR